MRTSSYTIHVKTTNPNEIIIVNSLTGATDVITSDVANYLHSLRKKGDIDRFDHLGEITEEVDGTVYQPSEATLARLEKRGYLTHDTDEEEQQHLVRLANMIHSKIRLRPSFLLIPSYDCNLRCTYCFQNDLRVKEENHPQLRVMTREHADIIFDAIRSLQPKDSDIPPTRSITLYGGEPFLAENLSYIEYIIEKCHIEGFQEIFAITNASELQHYMHVMGPKGVTSLQITLDGPREVHNQSRIHKDGVSGTFDQIVENIGQLLHKGVQVNLRVNVTRMNAPRLGELAKIIRDRDWEKYPHFRAYVAPVHYPSKTPPPEGFTPQQLNLFMVEAALKRDPDFDLFARPEYTIKSQFLNMFLKKTVISPRSSFCSSHTGMYLFDALGNIYACWEWVGFSQLRIGKLDFDTGAMKFNEKMLERWRNRTIASIPACRKCQYALYCGGGCAVYATQSGKFMSNHCDSFPANFQQGVKDAYAEYLEQQKQVATVTETVRDIGSSCR